MIWENFVSEALIRRRILHGKGKKAKGKEEWKKGKRGTGKVNRKNGVPFIPFPFPSCFLRSAA